MVSDADAASALAAVIQRCRWLVDVLAVVRDVGDGFSVSCWVGAGAVRDLLWDSWYGVGAPHDPAAFDGTAVNDVDVVFFDADRTDPTFEDDIEAALTRRRADITWDVTNQATVHVWYEDRFGYAVAPLTSVADGVGTWPETATAVAVAGTPTGGIDIVAPLGLQDLLAGVYRRNPRRVSVEEYQRRIDRLDPADRWPDVMVHGG